MRDALLAGVVREGISKELTFKQRSEVRNQAMENLQEECTRLRNTVSLKDCHRGQLSRFEVWVEDLMSKIGTVMWRVQGDEVGNRTQIFQAPVGHGKGLKSLLSIMETTEES